MFGKIRQLFCKHYFNDTGFFSPDCRYDVLLKCEKCGKEVMRYGAYN